MFWDYTPPEGYEIRTVDNERPDGEYAKVVPYFHGKPISAGKYLDIYGYRAALRRAKQAIRAHRKNNVDRGR